MEATRFDEGTGSASPKITHSDISTFATNSVNLKREDAKVYREQVNRLREKLDGFIGEHPEYGLVKMLLSGSLAKGTALKTINDIDVALYVKAGEAPKDEVALLEWIAVRLRKTYPQMAPDQIKPATHCVRISFKGTGLDVDVSPVHYDDDPQWRGHLYNRDTGKPLLTSIPMHIDFIRKRKSKQPDDFAQVVRLVKWWVKQRKKNDESFRLKSFISEMLVSHLSDTGVSMADYQHLYSWFHILELMKPRMQVARVRVEDDDAVSADDVTVRHADDSGAADRFYQIKYHMTQAGHYSTDYLIEKEGNKSSLLQKLFRSWRALRAAEPARVFEIQLISNWGWDTSDKLKPCIGGPANALLEDFFAATERMDVGILRKKWQDHLGAPRAEFEAFMRSLRFKLGFECWDEMMLRVSERMDSLGLKSTPTELLIAAGIVREWIKTGPQNLTLDVLEEAIQKHDLRLPPNEEPSVHVYLVTIKEQKYDVEPEYTLDWRPQFAGPPNEKGHQLKNPDEWNTVLLPKLRRLEGKINKETSCRLIRARGQARLSAWLAFGNAFSEVNRYKIEVDQLGKHWRTDAEMSPDFDLQSNGPDGEVMAGTGETVAVGISVTGDLAGDVRKDLASRAEKVASLLLIRPERPLGHDSLRGAGDAVALAVKAKDLMAGFVRRWGATKLLLYYYGPLSGATFIGHKLNAVCRQVQIMENQQPGYAPSFLLP